MCFAIESQSFEAFEIQFLWVAGVGFEDDLILGVHLHAVGVFSKASIVGAIGRFSVCDVPGFGSEYAQYCGGVHGACAHFFAVGLPYYTAVVGPEALEAHDQVLKVQVVAHGWFLGWWFVVKGQMIP